MIATKRPLPKGWRWVALREHVRPVQTFSTRSFPSPQFNYIDITSVDNVRKRVVGSKAYEKAKAPARAQSIVAKNDIIVSTVRPNLNAVALLAAEHDGFVCSSGFCVVRLGQEQHSPYYFRVLTSPYFVKRMTALVQGAMYPAVSDSDVLDTPIPLPPTLDDQIAIAAELERKLSKVESMRQAAERQIGALTALPGAILREVFDFAEPGGTASTPSAACGRGGTRPSNGVLGGAPSTATADGRGGTRPSRATTAARVREG